MRLLLLTYVVLFCVYISVTYYLLSIDAVIIFSVMLYYFVINQILSLIEKFAKGERSRNTSDPEVCYCCFHSVSL